LFEAKPVPVDPAASATIVSAAYAKSGGPKPPYPPPAPLPTQVDASGVRFDFNAGCRVMLPPRAAGSWRVCLRDRDSGNVLFRSVLAQGFIHSSKCWWIRFRVEVEAVDAEDSAPGEPVFVHEYDARDRDVLIQFPIGTLGDTLAWMPYAARFAERHGCRLVCALSGLIAPLLRDAYPTIGFVTHEELQQRALAGTFYATYSLGLFFDDVACNHQPTDFRMVGLHRTAAYILGVDPAEQPARIALPDDSRPIADPYVVIAVQASTAAKLWNNPEGWHRLITWLKAQGYRVICIDQRAVHGSGLLWNHIPHGVEDETGDRPLAERARWLRHAACFVGVSSGLAWLAWSAGCPVALISGFTHATNEFTTPFRVINWHACNSCWNDPKERFDHTDHQWCPRHANTPRQFECSRLITADAVIDTVRRALPASLAPDLAGSSKHQDCSP
jgi:autotransporter strand-loop-strand O-heptosyltransferase